MDARVTQIMEEAGAGFTPDFNAFSEKCDEKMNSFFEFCFARASVNPDQFADCLKERQEKLNKLIPAMEAKLGIFFPKKVNACLTEAKKSVPECTEEVRNGIRELL